MKQNHQWHWQCREEKHRKFPVSVRWGSPYQCSSCFWFCFLTSIGNYYVCKLGIPSSKFRISWNLNQALHSTGPAKLKTNQTPFIGKHLRKSLSMTSIFSNPYSSSTIFKCMCCVYKCVLIENHICLAFCSESGNIRKKWNNITVNLGIHFN